MAGSSSRGQCRACAGSTIRRRRIVPVLVQAARSRDAGDAGIGGGFFDSFSRNARLRNRGLDLVIGVDIEMNHPEVVQIAALRATPAGRAIVAFRVDQSERARVGGFGLDAVAPGVQQAAESVQSRARWSTVWEDDRKSDVPPNRLLAVDELSGSGVTVAIAQRCR